jgi:hypothetical protein
MRTKWQQFQCSLWKFRCGANSVLLYKTKTLPYLDRIGKYTVLKIVVICLWIVQFPLHACLIFKRDTFLKWLWIRTWILINIYLYSCIEWCIILSFHSFKTFTYIVNITCLSFGRHGFRENIKKKMLNFTGTTHKTWTQAGHGVGYMLRSCAKLVKMHHGNHFKENVVTYCWKYCLNQNTDLDPCMPRFDSYMSHPNSKV